MISNRDSAYYLWEGKASNGGTVSGISYDLSRRGLKSSLSQQGIFSAVIRRISPALATRSLSTKRLLMFVSSLRLYLQSGMTVDRSLSCLLSQTSDLETKYVCAELLHLLNAGLALPDAFRRLSAKFPPLMVSVLSSAEDVGRLEKLLGKLEGYYTAYEKSLKAMQTALRYPLLLLLFLFALYLFAMLYIVPAHKSLLDMRTEALPLPTVVLIGMSDALKHGWQAGVAVLSALALILVTTPKLRARLANFFSDTLFWFYNKHFDPLVYVIVMRLLLASGFNAASAITLMAGNGDRIANKIFKPLQQLMHHGIPLSEAVNRSGLFPENFKEVIDMAEQTGDEENAFAQLEAIQQSVWNNASEKISVYLQPALLSVISAFVAFLLLAVYQPMFSIGL